MSDYQYTINTICYTSIDCAKSSIDCLMNSNSLGKAKSVLTECLSLENKKSEPRVSLVNMLETKLRVIERKLKKEAAS